MTLYNICRTNNLFIIFITIIQILSSHFSSASPAAVALPKNVDGTLELIILHNNDMHARFDQTNILSDRCIPEDVIANNCYGGFSRVAHIVKKYREDSKNGGKPVLYLNAGDTFTGTPWFKMFREKIVNEFLNELMPDAASLGNHEFDLRLSGLINYLNDAKFPVVTANMDISNIPDLQSHKTFSNYTILNVAGVNIGVIGYVTRESTFLSNVKSMAFSDEVTEINKYAAELKEQGVKIIIALGHSGVEIDQIIARDCPLVDIVVGGHSHTFLYSGENPSNDEIKGPYPIVVKQKSGKKVPVVQAYAFTKYMGKLSVTFDGNGDLISFSGKPILLDNKIPNDDKETMELLEKYRPHIDELFTTIIGQTLVNLDADCRFRECNLGNLITDAMVYENAINYTGDYWTDASIAILQSGGIRASISKGNITLYDLSATLPFDDTKIVKVNLTGSEILDVLEHSIHRYDNMTGRGEFLQMSGIQVVYHLSKENGSRVESVNIMCNNCNVPKFYPLIKTRQYGVLLTTFLLNGGDGFEMFIDKNATILDLTDFDVVQLYIEQMKVIYPANEWRITLKHPGNSATQNVISMVTICFCLLATVVRNL